jgi:hypothetical protein
MSELQTNSEISDILKAVDVRLVWNKNFTLLNLFPLCKEKRVHGAVSFLHASAQNDGAIMLYLSLSSSASSNIYAHFCEKLHISTECLPGTITRHCGCLSNEVNRTEIHSDV